MTAPPGWVSGWRGGCTAPVRGRLTTTVRCALLSEKARPAKGSDLQRVASRDLQLGPVLTAGGHLGLLNAFPGGCATHPMVTTHVHPERPPVRRAVTDLCPPVGRVPLLNSFLDHICCSSEAGQK